MRSAFVVIAVRPVMVVAFATGLTLVLVVPLALATGIGFALFDVFWNTTMAEQIPPHALSRARAWEWMGSLILLPVAFWPRGRSPSDQQRDRPRGRRDPHGHGAGAGAPAHETRMLRRVEHGSHV
jgi:hypothetical protein